MKSWVKYSMAIGAILVIIGLVWSVVAGNPVWSEFIDACNDGGCSLLGNRSRY
ncbi:hypothetical protein FWC63_03085 [Candidatus Saccharibacteria bacterium]|nr:hypothetical protein [Candidatus Saccharibacteria bacterium]